MPVSGAARHACPIAVDGYADYRRLLGPPGGPGKQNALQVRKDLVEFDVLICQAGSLTGRQATGKECGVHLSTLDGFADGHIKKVLEAFSILKQHLGGLKKPAVYAGIHARHFFTSPCDSLALAKPDPCRRM